MAWNDLVLGDMAKGFLLRLLAVSAVLVLCFRSFKWAPVSYVPLVVTILIIYGCVAFVGKDFDVPIWVLSTLSLGMAVDFAIHYISRFRDKFAEINSRSRRADLDPRSIEGRS
ncbi:MAG: hypothetical protein ACREXM_07755 [Gammaproteobacteria bacterium]